MKRKELLHLGANFLGFGKPVCVVDVETTGSSPVADRVIDIGILRIETDGTVRSFETLLNPSKTILQSITLLTGIRNEDLFDAPRFDEVALTVRELLQDAMFVAHNVRFDHGFIKSEFARCEIKPPSQMFCSVRFFRELDGKNLRHNLDSVCERYGVQVYARHRAYSDAEAVVKALLKARETHGEEKFLQAVEHTCSGARLPKELSSEVIASLPDSPGVYFFYDESDTLLYIGKSKHIRTRVRSHFSDGNDTKRHFEMCSRVARVGTEETSGELGALLRESELVKELCPEYNRLLTRKKKLVIAKEVVNEEGGKCVKLEVGDTVPKPGGDVSVLRVYRSLSQAKASLQKLAAEHSLCQKLMGLEKTGRSCFAYQLGRGCEGVCVGKESTNSYNKRHDAVFKNLRMKEWPYKGAVIIKEQRSDVTDVFVVDNWRFIAKGTYDETDALNWENLPGVFEYDTYKIIARYLLDSKNKRSISRVSESELKQLFATQEDEEVVFFPVSYVT